MICLKTATADLALQLEHSAMVGDICGLCLSLKRVFFSFAGGLVVV